MAEGEVYKMRNTGIKRIRYEIVIEVESDTRVKSISNCLENWLEEGAHMARNEDGIWHKILSVNVK